MLPLYDDNPTHRLPILTIGLILINLLVFGYQLSLPNTTELGGEIAFSCEYGMVPAHVLNGPDPALDLDANIGGDVSCQGVNQEQNRFLGLFTSQFLHGGWLHLLGNMLFLWVFGNNIEDRLGRLRFIPFYLMCGALAALAQGVWALRDTAEAGLPLIGASGAISGVMGAYLALFPKAGIWTLVAFVFPLKIPAWLWIGIYLVLQFIYLGDSGSGSGVAYLAHIGGLVAGFALIRPLLAGRDEPPPPSAAIPRTAF
jgi:membrane associated rhomboid family serine protease